MRLDTLRAVPTAALAAIGVWASPQLAIAADANDVAQKALPPQIKARMAEAKVRRAQLTPQLAGMMDTTPPALTAFNAAAAVDAAVSGSTMSVSFKATDDLSGVSAIYAWATGPSGQYVDVSFHENVPSTKFSGKMHSSGLLPYLEPGVYTFTGAYVEDFAGNDQIIDAVTLAALGKVSFTVKNKKGFDVTTANLVSGQVLTPRVVLSVPHTGTANQPPFVQVALTATDVGNTVISGVGYAIAVFCLIDSTDCIHTSSMPSAADPRATSANLKLGARVSGAYRPGDHILRSVTIGDFAGNNKTWTSTVFGGQTDFSTYFPSTTIELVP